jgi:hypothetical protein
MACVKMAHLILLRARALKLMVQRALCKSRLQRVKLPIAVHMSLIGSNGGEHNLLKNL